MSDSFSTDFASLRDLFQKLSREWVPGTEGQVRTWRRLLGVGNDPCLFLYGLPFAEVGVSIRPPHNGAPGHARVHARVDSVDDSYAAIHYPDEPREKAHVRASRVLNLLTGFGRVPTLAEMEKLAQDTGGYFELS